MKIFKGKKKFNPNIIWKEYYDIDLEYEKIVYRYLCGILKRKKLKRLKIEDRFERYYDWKEYVKLKLGKLDNMDELYRFLNLKKRGTNSYKEVYGLFCIPIFVFLFSEMIMDFTKIFNNVKIQDIIKVMESLHSLGAKIIVAVFCIIIFALMIIILSGLPFFMVYVTIIDHWKANEEANFMEDYMEIIKEMIDEKANLS